MSRLRSGGGTHGNGVYLINTPRRLGVAPDGCNRIVIVGAGGFGREVLQWARHAWPNHSRRIVGFLSDDPGRLDGHATSLPIVGSPEGFELRPTDGLLLAIGIPGARRKVAEHLEARRANFLTLIHPTAIVTDTAVVGAGTIICPYAIVSDAVKLGRLVLVNYHASLGHDAEVGDFGVLSPYSTIGGRSVIGADVFLGLHASVGPARRLGAGSVVSANSAALVDVPENCLVYGVPGRVAPKLEVATK